MSASTRRRAPLFALLAATGISYAGNTMTLVAVPWFVLQTTGSAGRAGLAAFFATLPVALSAGLGGALVDRLGYRRATITADVASGVTIALVPVVHLTVGLPFWGLLGLVFLGALLDAPGHTARSALVPELAEQAGMPLERAASALDAVERASRMAGGPIAGVLIALVGASQVLLVDAATFAVSATLLLLAVPRAVRAADEPAPGRYLSQLREGFAFIRHDPLIRAMVVMVLFTNMLDGAYSSVALPVYADRVLDSAVALGLMVGVFGVGAMTGALLFGAIGPRLPRYATYTVAFLVAGAPRFFVLAAFPSLPVVLVSLGLFAVGAGAINPILSTVEYERVPVGMRGRVFGAITAGVFCAIPLGGLLAGGLLELVGLRTTLLGLGVAYLLATLSPLVVPAWRQMDAPAPEAVTA